jgi:hypothetical protein
METAIRSALCAVATVVVVLVAAACGPRNLSALGNPGDFCTESSACTDGSDCRQTEDGFRCVGGQAEKAPAARDEPVTIIEDDAGPGHFAVEDGAEPNVEPPPEVATDDASADAEPAQGDEPQEYLPPSRRRRGRR